MATQRAKRVHGTVRPRVCKDDSVQVTDAPSRGDMVSCRGRNAQEWELGWAASVVGGGTDWSDDDRQP